MAQSFAYNYAEINPATGMCVGVHSTSSPNQASEEFIPIKVRDEKFIRKFYVNDNWFEDAAGTIPWQSSLL